MDTQGGRLQITIGSTTYSCRGKCQVDPSLVSVDAGVNWDGKGYKTVKPELAAVSLSFDRGKGLPWTQDWMLKDENVTIVELDAGVTHYLTAATKVGKPTIDTENGEVSGVSLKSDAYRSTTV